MKLTSGVILSDPAELRAAYELLQHGKHTMRRNGYRLTPTHDQIISDIGALALGGHADVRPQAPLRHYPRVVTDPISTRQAAQLLGVSTRQARRLARDTGAIKRAGVWVWSKQQLLNYMERKH